MKVLDYLLEEVEPLTNMVIENTKSEIIKNGHVWTKRDETWVRLCIQHKLIQAVSRYIKQNDVITNVEPFVKNGVITARIVLERGYINTEVILAGGYNIQRLHTRYIIDTNLPIKDENKAMVKELAKRKRNFTKLENAEKMVNVYTKSLEDNKVKLADLKAMSKEDIINASNLSDIYYKPYSEYTKDHIKVVENNVGKDLSTEEKWKQHIEESIYGLMLTHHNGSIIGKENNIKHYTKVVDKWEKEVKTLSKQF